MNQLVNQGDENGLPATRSAGGLAGWLFRFGRLRRLCPAFIKRLGWRLVDPEKWYEENSRTSDQYPDIGPQSEYPPRVDAMFGIATAHNNRHKRFAAACRDLGVPYRFVDITSSEWLDNVRAFPFDMLLVWPSVHLTVAKRMFDERLAVINEELGIPIYPSLKALWLYESKYRMTYWLAAHEVPQPHTRVFFRLAEAMDYADKVDLPIITKTDLGSGSMGVWVFRNRQALLKYVRRSFRSGAPTRLSDSRDRQWGSVLFQEYIPDAREWRMIRIGNSFFGYEKIKVGDFHSGSHKWSYSQPPDELLDLIERVTDIGDFSSMDLDVLVAKDGRALVSEMQTVFGMGNPWEMCVVDGKPGRMIRAGDTGKWVFEAGSFCDHWMCTLRVQAALERLGKLPVRRRTEPVKG